MQELLYQLLSYVRATWRRRWYALLVAWLVALVGWLVVQQLPDEYEASAQVYVDTDSVLRPLLSGLAIQTDVSQRVRLMTRTLFSRPNLEKVARMTDLDIAAKTPQDMEDLLNDLGENIRLRSGGGDRNLYRITYQNSQPELAKRVVQAILTIFVEGSLGEVRMDSDAAQKFLHQQIKEYEARLVEAENRLTDFNRKYVGMLPGQTDFFAQLKKTQAEVEKVKLDLRETERRRDELQRQVRELGRPEVSATTTSPLTASIDARIQALQTRLDELLIRFTDAHPDVIEARRTIAALEQQKKEELEAIAAKGITTRSEGSSLYQQLKLASAQTEAAIGAGRVRLQEYERRVDKLKQLVDTQPQIESERKRLNRDYTVTKEKYNGLLSRLESAKLSEEAEQTGDNVKFKVVDPPRVPLQPAAPNRPLLMTGVLFAALGAGIALAFVVSQLRPTFDNARALKDITGIPVLGAVSMTWSPSQRRRRRFGLASFATATLLLFVVYAGALLFQLPALDLSAIPGIGRLGDLL